MTLTWKAELTGPAAGLDEEDTVIHLYFLCASASFPFLFVARLFQCTRRNWLSELTLHSIQAQCLDNKNLCNPVSNPLDVALFAQHGLMPGQQGCLVLQPGPPLAGLYGMSTSHPQR